MSRADESKAKRRKKQTKTLVEKGYKKKGRERFSKGSYLGTLGVRDHVAHSSAIYPFFTFNVSRAD